MSTNEKYVTKEILGYYDSKIKEYIEDKVNETDADSTDIKELERRLDAVETLSSVNRDDIVEAEAAILTLQEDDKKITAVIAQKANKEDIPSIEGLATEEYVLTKIAEAELADKDVDLSMYYTKVETENKIEDAINNIKFPETDLSDYATKDELSALEVKIPSEETMTQINENIQTIQNNYVTNQYITENYTTTEQLEETYVTNEKVTEIVTDKVNTVITDQIETKVTEVIEQKIETGEISGNSDAINYDTW